jgi:hypothetical protein
MLFNHRGRDGHSDKYESNKMFNIAMIIHSNMAKVDANLKFIKFKR